ncbi:MAG: prenyltransferase [Thermogemmatispora sp.]|uniref:2-carboxy-1,4-naphthoquinone phytyltransferase n=1 Tax=Thermogemmatispora aurantia TaxID=2045279 RepID=A0A5J4KEQ7_9CHLR|nr:MULTISPECIES: prenyltransferase [Thermogemmatispora]MBE3567524.1 prenyltransferase [Thermogemmatispora sp.]GER85392.1 2-carboxy-1,4-naphthoquinone phytyltransferase [Thermogemmatispora aurantia]
MEKVRIWATVTRARTLPVMVAPVVLGAVLAWQEGYSFQWGLFLLTLVGALAAHLGANVVNDVFDFTAGADARALQLQSQGEALTTGSQALFSGRASLADYRRLWVILFAIALLCGLILSLWRPWVLALAGAGFLLAFFYVAPPLRLAYIGRGLGELDIFLSFGLLPLVGAYYVQAGSINLSAILAALPVGLYTTLVLYFHHFLHWRADREVDKKTPVVLLGEARARQLGAALLGLTALLIVIDILLGVFPWYGVLAALTVMPVYLALRRAQGELKQYLALMAQNMSSNLLAALLLVLALLVRGFTHF